MDLTLDENSAILAPMPFNAQQCRVALALKEAGLPWAPHVGCFVWDPNGYIPASSPFPGRIYFILNLEHFLKYFPSFEVMSQQLIWLPTWHQTRLLCAQFGVENEEIRGLWKTSGALSPGDDLFSLYVLLLGVLRQRKR